jgi:hypothetical protein
LANTRAQNRRSQLAAAAALSLCPLAAAPGASAANPGGTAPAGALTPVATTPPVPRGATPAHGSLTTPSAHVTSVRITSVSCTPAAHCGGNPHEVSVRGTLAIAGHGLRSGMVVAFPRSPGARISRNSPGARLRSGSSSLLVTVPGGAHSGKIMVLLGGGRHTSSYGPIYIVNHALHPPGRARPAPPPTGGSPSGTAFDGQGMWIWYLSQSNGGQVVSIAARAHQAGVGTVFVKSSDGSTNYWSQFSSQLVSELHANGIKVCAWQYVYGASPAGEANLGSRCARGSTSTGRRPRARPTSARAPSPTARIAW